MKVKSKLGVAIRENAKVTIQLPGGGGEAGVFLKFI